MLNKVMLIGRLGRDPEVRSTSSGMSVCNFSIATSEKTKDGELVEWHKCAVWGKAADACGQFLSKGSLVYLEGQLKARTYVGKDGTEKKVVEIHSWRVQFLTPKAAQPGSDAQERKLPAGVPASQPAQRTQTPNASDDPWAADGPVDDEIPF